MGEIRLINEIDLSSQFTLVPFVEAVNSLEINIVDPISISHDEVQSIHEGNENIVVIESDKSELIGKEVNTEQDAYDLYNDYAFVIGFSIRRSKQRKRPNQTDISMKQFCCSHEGRKVSKGKCYTKQDTRSDCKAKITFSVDAAGAFTVTKHEMTHNHKLCPEDKRHLLRSQRTVSKPDVEFLIQLIDSGVKLSDALRVLKKEKGGTPMLGFTVRDAYNEVAKEKRKTIEGTNANSLIQIFMRRKENKEDFFFDFELNHEGKLCNLFWRDGQMKKDYKVFGDITITDTTYRTNRYDMICGPFIGINHHGKNIMFGCGFLSDEKTESFIWLFKTFLKSMGDKQPTTIMTDQLAAMAAAIKVVFDKAHHRLCVWHIMENSKKHIRHLRALKGFVELFDLVLKYVETVAEFNFYWDRLETVYECKKNEWLGKLYKCRQKWCPAFSKDRFSGGILSSQRSESTNHSIQKRLYATAGLCDFYSCFVDVIHDWRSNENGDDFRCLQGNPEMISNHINILTHARKVYTIEIYYLFEEQYMKSLTLHQQLQEKNEHMYTYHVGKATKEQHKEQIKHVLTFNEQDKSICCTCRMYTQVGILCCHSLRVLNLHCVDDIPQQYILKRWTKEAKEIVVNEPIQPLQDTHVAFGSVWRMQITRKFNELISASQSNIRIRQCFEEAYLKLKQLVGDENKSASKSVSSCGVSEIEHSGTAASDVGNKTVIKNPSKSRQPGQRNVRRKPTLEKINNIVRGRKSKTFQVATLTKKTAEASVKEAVNSIVGEGYLVHPSNGGQVLLPVVPNAHDLPFCGVNNSYQPFVQPVASPSSSSNQPFVQSGASLSTFVNQPFVGSTLSPGNFQSQYRGWAQYFYNNSNTTIHQ